MILLQKHHIVYPGGYCARGTRLWCERHGIDYVHFVQHGINVEIIEKFDDAFAQEVCRKARDEHAAKQQEVNNG